MKKYNDILDLANEVIKVSNEKYNVQITHLQVQKTLYYLQCAFLSKYDKKLFSEKVECWPYGPVLRKVWRKYTGTGRSPLNYDDNISIEYADKDEKNLFMNITGSVVNKNIWKVVDDTHKEVAWKNAKESNSKFLSENDMKEVGKKIYG